MAINSNNVYLYTSSGTIKIPTNVTKVQIECYAPSTSTRDAVNNGGSYSKIYNFDVTSVTSLTVTVGANGGNTWVSNTGAQPTIASQGCLAYGGSQTPTYQTLNNIGDVKFGGGSGYFLITDGIQTAVGGQAGPNGPGGNVGYLYTNTHAGGGGPSSYCGGGANGGSVGSLGFYPYGRTGSGSTIGAGCGSYWNGTNNTGATIDVLGQASYLNGTIQNSLVNYGPSGGGGYYEYCSGGCLTPAIAGYGGFVVITLIYPVKYIVVTQTGQSSFTLPSDFVSINSLIAVGAGGNGASSNTTSCGGGGGGGYSSNIGGVTTSAGTTVWCQVPAAGSATTAYMKFGGASNIPPVNATQGVLANSGSNGVGITGGAGGSATGAIGAGGSTTAGGAGGNGSTTTTYRNHGGGGGPALTAGAGGTGGAGFATTTTRGSGGGGSAQGGNGGAGTNTSGGAGGGSGGSGAVGTSGTATSGTSGGGGGGGFGTTNINGSVGSALVQTNGLWQIGGGSGGNAAAGTVNIGAGGGGGSTTANTIGGNGILVLAYNTNAYAPPVSNGGFLQLM